MTEYAGSKPSTRTGKTSLLAPLTTFRFFAALAIVVFHAAQRPDYGFLASGVSFFFVLSGFVLTYVHPRLESRGSYSRFWIARFSRVWPLHFFTFLVVLIFRPFGPLPSNHFIFEAFCNISLLQCWVPVHQVCQSFNFVSWSLSVEMFFYATFPLLLPHVTRMPGRMILAAVILNIVLATAAAYAGLPDIDSVRTVSYGAFLFCPALHLFEFVLGMAVAIWWMRAEKKTTGSRTVLGWAEFVVFLGAALSLPYLLPLAHVLTFGETRYLIDHQLGSFLNAGIFALLIFVFAFQQGILSRLFSHPWLVYLGEVSFSIYMIHTIVMAPYERLHWTDQPVLKWAVYGIIVLGASSLLFGVLEKPVRKKMAAVLERTFGVARA